MLAFHGRQPCLHLQQQMQQLRCDALLTNWLPCTNHRRIRCEISSVKADTLVGCEAECGSQHASHARLAMSLAGLRLFSAAVDGMRWWRPLGLTAGVVSGEARARHGRRLQGISPEPPIYSCCACKRMGASGQQIEQGHSGRNPHRCGARGSSSVELNWLCSGAPGIKCQIQLTNIMARCHRRQVAVLAHCFSPDGECSCQPLQSTDVVTAAPRKNQPLTRFFWPGESFS